MSKAPSEQPGGDDPTLDFSASQKPTQPRQPRRLLPEIPGVTLGPEIARGGMGVVYHGVQDYLDREANHRESILDLPTLTQADIGEFYDAFTDLRERMLASRVAADASIEQLRRATDHVHERASTG